MVLSKQVDESTRKARNAYLLRTYGITIDEFECLLALQNNRCAICGKDLRGLRIEVDHEHTKHLSKRRQVRGLLCGGRYAGCNRRLGRVDNAAWLSAAARYVSEPPARRYLDDV